MAAEHSRQMRLVADPASERDLAEGFVRCEHQVLGTRYPTPGDIGGWCHTEAALERSREMAGAQARGCSQFGHPEGRIEMGIDVSVRASHLPRGEPTAHQSHRRMFVTANSPPLDSEQSRCASNAGPSSIAIAIDRFVGILEEPDQDCGQAFVLRGIVLAQSVLVLGQYGDDLVLIHMRHLILLCGGHQQPGVGECWVLLAIFLGWRNPST